MADTFREEVIQRLVAVLQTITGSRTLNGFTFSYPNTPQVITELRQNEQINHRPTLQVIQVSGSAIGNPVLAPGGLGVEHALELQIIGYVRADATATAATWARRLWDDVFKTLYANMTLLSSGAQKVSRMDLGPLETDEGMLAPEGEFLQPVTITCHETVATD